MECVEIDRDARQIDRDVVSNDRDAKIFQIYMLSGWN